MSCAGTTNAPGRVIVGAFAAVRVYMGFPGVFLVNEIQADPLHVVMLVFLFASYFGFEFAGGWDVSKVPLIPVV